MNVVPGFKSARNGSILSAAANAYATWLTSPNHDRMSVMFAGVGKSRIDSRNFQSRRIQRYPARIQICSGSTLFHFFRTTVAIPLPGGMLQ